MRKRWTVFLAMAMIFLFSATSLAAKTLTVYVTYDAAEAKIIISQFEKDTGIRVKWVRMSSGTTLNRIRAEKKHPQADVWTGGPSDSYVTAAEYGLLEPYIPPNAKNIPAKYRDPKGYWNGIYLGIIGFGTNKNYLAKMQKKNKFFGPPTSWMDLLNPYYRNNIQMPNPGSSGTALTIVSTLIQIFGWDKAFDYLKMLDRQIQLYTEHGATGGTSAGLGQCAIGVIFGQDILHRIYEKHYPLILTFPKEGTGYEIGGTALIKGAKHVKEAKTFINWMLSKRAQNLWAKTGFFHFPTAIGATPPKGWPPLEKIHLINYDAKWTGENRDKIVNTWTKEILEKRKK